MLITTHCGILINSDFIAYVLVRREEQEDLTEETGNPPLRFKVALCFATGDSIIAAIHLSVEQATFLRQDIGHAWAEGDPAYSVPQALKRHQEGAYYAEEVGSLLPIPGGG